MKLNAFGDVCLRTLMLLGAQPESQLTSREIAEAIGIPYNHVSKAVLELRQRGALEVARGRVGGARITAAGLQLTVGELLRSLDHQPDIVDCVSGDHVCPLIAGCRLRGALNRAREAFYSELDGLSVAELSATQTLGALPFPAIRRREDEGL
ncbi:Rrf2 family nitric oxide-sensitive transcriptional repressor [Neomicrococcus aestuarii]|uniref:Rrf2 family nitric oxide-sensitive transcriptional repressor n=1 Tax=Neomicrococcus aestuarii TaxID=556325 RepID=A0A7W8TT73_9MICC|nr:Rrf2 family transcriptional regulator [Neomicrococcus aestuarii]MBB5512399.1 Rrf2 family nitric oxide-sensitive transcriptional repressor [Neomicrococcus aestuarii]